MLAVVFLFITMPLCCMQAEPPYSPPPDPGGDPGPGGTPVGAPFGNGAVVLITLAMGYGMRKLYQLREDHPAEIWREDELES